MSKHRSIIESVLGNLDNYEEIVSKYNNPNNETWIRFDIKGKIKFQQLNELSEKLGTERIDISPAEHGWYGSFTNAAIRIYI